MGGGAPVRDLPEERGAGGRSVTSAKPASLMPPSLFMRCRLAFGSGWFVNGDGYQAGGSFIVADYALPRNRVASALAYHIFKPYGRDHYGSFVKADVVALTKSAGIELSDHLGLAQVMTGRRSEAVSQSSASLRTSTSRCTHFPGARTRPGSNTRTLPSPRLLSMRPSRR
jgi:hypothetical protein